MLSDHAFCPIEFAGIGNVNSDVHVLVTIG